PYCKITILKVDPDGVTIWENSYGGVFLWNTVSKIKKLPDGNYIAAGHTACEPMSARREGWLLKFSDNGDSIWYRQYSNVPGLAENNFHDIDLTDDGGFIMGGSINIYELPIPPVHQLMWALKVDSMGCDTPGCATGTNTFEFVEEKNEELRVWPNPAKDKFRALPPLIPPGGGKSLQLMIYNSQGVKVEEINVPDGKETILINAQSWQKGIYLVHVVIDGKITGTRKLIKH
ncbi:MAG: T9SS type A sorting domain-containing protein, partial [Bacteroidales bacterium]|nr:T9SS type A sorting domain-containing protein [Bacteroidales bacterium]